MFTFLTHVSVNCTIETEWAPMLSIINLPICIGKNSLPFNMSILTTKGINQIDFILDDLSLNIYRIALKGPILKLDFSFLQCHPEFSVSFISCDNNNRKGKPGKVIC